MIVLDTNALIHWLVDSDGISPALKRRLEAEEKLYCSVSLWEVGLKIKQGKLTLPWTVREIQHRLPRVRNLSEAKVDGELWIESLELDWDHRDPADRLIVALARQMDCDLATTDGAMHDYYKKSVR